MEENYGILDVAMILSIHPETIRYHIRQGHIKPRRELLDGRSKYVFETQDVRDLKKYLLKEQV